MKRMIARLRRNESGASAIEFAIAVPVLVSMIYGIFTIGLLFQANAGLQHALGEAARAATLFPTPTDEQLQDMLEAKEFGLGGGTLETPVISTDSTNHFMTISLTYHRPLHFLFVDGPTVTLTKSKKVYLAY